MLEALRAELVFKPDEFSWVVRCRLVLHESRDYALAVAARYVRLEPYTNGVWFRIEPRQRPSVEHAGAIGDGSAHPAVGLEIDLIVICPDPIAIWCPCSAKVRIGVPFPKHGCHDRQHRYVGNIEVAREQLGVRGLSGRCQTRHDDAD